MPEHTASGAVGVGVAGTGVDGTAVLTGLHVPEGGWLVIKYTKEAHRATPSHSSCSPNVSAIIVDGDTYVKVPVDPLSWNNVGFDCGRDVAW